MAMSTALKNAILDKYLRNTNFSITTVYLSLHNGDPGATGANEITGGSYIRQAITFAAASGGVIATSADLTFLDMPADTVTHVGIFDSATTGGTNVFEQGGALTASKVVNAGDTFIIEAGDLSATFTP